MAFKTLMTHLTGIEADAALLGYVTDLANAGDAHLDVLCHGVDHMTAGFHYGAVDPMMVQQSLQAAVENASALETSAKLQLDLSLARWSAERIISPQGSLARNVALRSRFSDLVVLRAPYGSTQHADAEGVLEGALLSAAVPVLVLPSGSVPSSPRPEKIIVAWNESAEALAAVRAALPLLKAADQVRVTVIDPPRHGPDRSDPGGPLSVYLARHGVKVEIDVIGKSLPRVSDVLIRHATDRSADMVVMGAYGRSRLREAILGGATRDMLEASPLPVFMQH